MKPFTDEEEEWLDRYFNNKLDNLGGPITRDETLKEVVDELRDLKIQIDKLINKIWDFI